MADEKMTDSSSNQAILSAIEELKSSISREVADKDRDPFWWKVAQVVLPVALTAALGFFVWVAQARIQTTLGQQTSRFSAELGLRQLLFERRLDAYRQIYDKAWAAYLTMKAGEPEAHTIQDQLDRDAHMLSELTNSSRLLSSEDLNKLLFAMWLQTAQGRSIGDTNDLLGKVATQMRKDLKIDEVDAVGAAAQPK